MFVVVTCQVVELLNTFAKCSISIKSVFKGAIFSAAILQPPGSLSVSQSKTTETSGERRLVVFCVLQAPAVGAERRMLPTIMDTLLSLDL